MTHGNPRPDEEPAPPTSTGRSDASDAYDDELAPPFVPGGSTPARRPAPEDTEASGQGGPDPLAAPFTPEPEADEAHQADEGAFPFETGWDADRNQGGEGAGAPDDEDDFPMEAFDIEEGQASWLEEAAPAGEASPKPGGGDTGDGHPEQWEAAPESTEAAETHGMHAARELAGRLEEMARRLRDQGPEAARAELESPDRFTALLAGLLAGYLAGRE